MTPSDSLPRLPVGLCVFGMAYLCGLTWAGTDHANREPLTGLQVIDLAAHNGFSHVEMPLQMLAETGDLDALKSARRYAEERGVGFIFPSARVNAESLLRDLPAAAALGATVMRCVLSGVLCGDRRGFPGGWGEHVRACAEELEAVVPEAERLGIAIAIENHQDANSDDLLQICRRFESRYLGVTLDCGNPLAVMEEPVAFATRLAPYLRHAHLKDYRVYPALNGFRLVRCPFGEGVIDFPALFRLFEAQEWPITRNLELGAPQARQIPILEPSWWDEYPSRDTRDVLPALEVVWKHLRPADEDGRTPYEQDRGGEELAAYEWEQFRRSLANLRSLAKV